MLRALNVPDALRAQLREHPNLPITSIYDIRQRWDFSKVTVCPIKYSREPTHIPSGQTRAQFIRKIRRVARSLIPRTPRPVEIHRGPRRKLPISSQCLSQARHRVSRIEHWVLLQSMASGDVLEYAWREFERVEQDDGVDEGKEE